MSVGRRRRHRERGATGHDIRFAQGVYRAPRRVRLRRCCPVVSGGLENQARTVPGRRREGRRRTCAFCGRRCSRGGWSVISDDRGASTTRLASSEMHSAHRGGRTCLPRAKQDPRAAPRAPFETRRRARAVFHSRRRRARPEISPRRPLAPFEMPRRAPPEPETVVVGPR